MMGLDWRGSDSQGLYGQGTRGNGQTDFLFFRNRMFPLGGSKKRRWSKSEMARGAGLTR